MREFEQEMSTLAREVSEKMELIQRKCAEGMHDEESKQGVLRQHYARYANCFMINTVEFLALLAADREIWEKELQATADDIQDRRTQAAVKAKEMQEEIQERMNSLRGLISSKSLDEEEGAIKLRKLPLFGKRVPDDQIDFEFPSGKEFQKL